jgi:SOS-response transcriptional repressor LexA
MSPLTPAEKLCLDFIRDFIEKNNMSPTTNEIAEGLNWRTAQKVVEALIAKGRIDRQCAKPRSIRVIENLPITADWLESIGFRQDAAEQAYKLCVSTPGGKPWLYFTVQMTRSGGMVFLSNTTGDRIFIRLMSEQQSLRSFVEITIGRKLPNLSGMINRSVGGVAS